MSLFALGRVYRHEDGRLAKVVGSAMIEGRLYHVGHLATGGLTTMPHNEIGWSDAEPGSWDEPQLPCCSEATAAMQRERDEARTEWERSAELAADIETRRRADVKQLRAELESAQHTKEQYARVIGDIAEAFGFPRMAMLSAVVSKARSLAGRLQPMIDEWRADVVKRLRSFEPVEGTDEEIDLPTIELAIRALEIMWSNEDYDNEDYNKEDDK